MISPGHSPAPLEGSNEKEHRRRIAMVANGAQAGRLNATTSVTLAPSMTSTTLTDPRIGASTVALLFPATASAAAAMGTVYTSLRGQGAIMFGHNSSATTDRTFDVVLISG